MTLIDQNENSKFIINESSLNSSESTNITKTKERNVPHPTERRSSSAVSLQEVEDKVTNLNRLLSLYQNLYETRDADVRRENDMLRLRISRLEEHNETIMRLLEENNGKDNRAKEEMKDLRTQIQSLAQIVEEMNHKISDYTCERTDLSSIEKKMIDLLSSNAMLSTQANMCEEKLQQFNKEALEEIKVTREWAKRNLERLKKQHLLLRDAVPSLAQDIQFVRSLVEKRCSADNKCHKLKALLRKRTDEVSIMTHALDRELEQIRDVTGKHTSSLQLCSE